jgi:hypothetical protein
LAFFVPFFVTCPRVDGSVRCAIAVSGSPTQAIPVKESERMRRSIEITVYRQATVVFRDESGNKSCPSEPVSPVSVHAEKSEKGEAQLTIGDLARSPELMLLIEALVRNVGSSTRTVREPGQRRTGFISRLRRFAFGSKQ